jgi:GNAT superfamily N-acetyltransferase
VTDDGARIERFRRIGHDVSDFASGNEMLDRWLQRSAGQSDRRDAARTFVAALTDGTVRGYYTLVAGQIEHGDATPTTRKGLSSHFPVPVAILARLAVDRRSQGHGLGSRLLSNALERVCHAAEDVAVRAVLVHAVDDDAATFYERLGFLANTATPRTLMVTLAELRAAGYGSSDTADER